MNIEKPVARPDNAYFSSGPCAKYPTFSTNKLLSAAVGRSHRASVGKKKLKQLIDGVREILEVPSDYQVGIVLLLTLIYWVHTGHKTILKELS